MLARATSSSSSGAWVVHSARRCASTSTSSPSIQAVRGERRAVDAARHGRVDAGERVVEARAERPARVVVGLDEAGVGNRFIVFGLGHHMWGTCSGTS